MSLRPNPKVALINIGSELLSGRTVNTNASEIGKLLGEAGYFVDHTVAIHDEEDDIRNEIERALIRHEIVIVTGGLGPTKDDITKKTLTDLFGGELVTDEPTLQRLESWYRNRNRKMNPAMAAQAMIPTSCEILNNEVGSAPGMLFRKDYGLCFSIPGVPQEMRWLLINKIIPIIQGEFEARQNVKKVLRVFNIPESSIEMKMRPVFPQLHESIRLAFLPTDGEVKIEVKQDRSKGGEEDLDAAYDLVCETFEKYIFAKDDTPLEEVFGKMMKEEGLSVATAESCTGGGIARKITSVSGSSKYFKGSIVAYQPEIKMQELDVPAEIISEHSVVSAEVAVAMAESIRKKFNTDLGISITGVAESVPGDPVYGSIHAWFGFDYKGQSWTEHYLFFQDRESNIRRAANIALFTAIRRIKC